MIVIQLGLQFQRVLHCHYQGRVALFGGCHNVGGGVGVLGQVPAASDGAVVNGILAGDAVIGIGAVTRAGEALVAIHKP